MLLILKPAPSCEGAGSAFLLFPVSPFGFFFFYICVCRHLTAFEQRCPFSSHAHSSCNLLLFLFVVVVVGLFAHVTSLDARYSNHMHIE